jgi:hypothetical protein
MCRRDFSRSATVRMGVELVDAEVAAAEDADLRRGESSSASATWAPPTRWRASRGAMMRAGGNASDRGRRGT